MDAKKLEDKLTNLSSVCADLDPVLSKISSSLQCKENDVMIVATGIAKMNVIVDDLNQFLEEGERLKGHYENMRDRFAHLQTTANSVLKTVEEHIENGLVIDTPPAFTTANENNAGPNLKPKGTTSKPIPHMEHLNEEELAEVPNYMKGRLQLSEINAIIDKFNKTVTEKYRLMKKPRKQLSVNEKKRFNAYRMQETKETSGCYFCTSDDLQEMTGLKLIHSTWAIFTILRHCNRLKEIRGPNKLVRYCIQTTAN